MSTQPLILKNGVITFPRSSTDIADVNTSLGITAALALKANSISPNLSGTPTTPTPIAGTNTTQIANCIFVNTAISNLVASSPAALDTLNELAAALGNDANFSTTVTNSLASRVDLTTNQTVNGVKTFLGSLVIPNSSGSIVGTIWRSTDDLQYRDSSNNIRILLSSAGNLSNLANRQIALNNLVGVQTANRVLRSDGTNLTLSQINLLADVTNSLPIANGGTGSSTQNFVDLSNNQTIAGAKTLTSALTIRGDVGIMNLLGNNDAYNTFRFTASINTSTSYWDIGVGPSSLNRDFYISSGYAGGGLGFRINATNYNFTLSGAMIVTNNTAATSTNTGSGRFGGGLSCVGNFYAGGSVINFSTLPTSSSGLASGSLWRNGNIVNIV